MTRVATTDNEDYLLRIARHGTAHHVETLVRKYRRSRKLQETGDAKKQHNERSVHFYYEPDGSMVIKARLPAEKAQLVLKAIELAMEQADPPETKDSAESSGIDVDGNELSPVPMEKEGWDKQRADALANIAESYLANGPASSSSADRYQVVLHVSAETLTNNEGHISHLQDGPHVSAETSRRLCCDAGISVLTEDEDGTPLNIGRKSRIIPPAMRRALKARDEGCQFPGCTLKYYIDGHHIKHWSKGGETSLANLVQLCRHHHRLVHEGGFSRSKNTLGKVEFRNPKGELIARTGYIPAFSGMLDITERMRNRYEDLFIDANTCVTKYDGGGIDWNMAVSAMYQ